MITTVLQRIGPAVADRRAVRSSTVMASGGRRGLVALFAMGLG